MDKIEFTVLFYYSWRNSSSTAKYLDAENAEDDEEHAADKYNVADRTQ